MRSAPRNLLQPSVADKPARRRRIRSVRGELRFHYHGYSVGDYIRKLLLQQPAIRLRRKPAVRDDEPRAFTNVRQHAGAHLDRARIRDSPPEICRQCYRPLPGNRPHSLIVRYFTHESRESRCLLRGKEWPAQGIDDGATERSGRQCILQDIRPVIPAAIDLSENN
jgi:hypothetical protein